MRSSICTQELKKHSIKSKDMQIKHSVQKSSPALSRAPKISLSDSFYVIAECILLQNLKIIPEKGKICPKGNVATRSMPKSCHPEKIENARHSQELTTCRPCCTPSLPHPESHSQIFPKPKACWTACRGKAKAIKTQAGTTLQSTRTGLWKNKPRRDTQSM